MFSWNCVVGGETLEVLNDFKEVTLGCLHVSYITPALMLILR